MSRLGIARIAAPLVAGALLVWLVFDWLALRRVDQALNTCVAAVKTLDRALTSCKPEIAVAVTGDRRAQACDAGLNAKPRNEFTVRTSCSTAGKRVFAELIVATGDLADVRAQLAQSRTDMAGAVARAESRSSSLASRKAANDATLAAAPRAADGRVRCDAECLRALADAPPR